MNIEKLEKEFKQQLEDHQAFDLDADSTWQAIEKELDGKRKNKRLIFFCLLGLCGLVGLLGIGIVSVDGEPVGNMQVQKIHQTADSTALIVAVDEKVLYPVNAIDGDDLKEGKQRANASTLLDNASSFVREKYAENVGLAQQSRDEYLPIDGMVMTYPSTQNVREKALPESLQPVDLETDNTSGSNMTRVLREQNQPLTIVNSVVYIPRKQQVVSKLESSWAYLSSEEMVSLPDISGNLAMEPRLKSQLRLAFTGRIFQSTNGIANKGPQDYSTLREQSETPQLSWSIGGDLYREKRKGWLLGIGLGYREEWVKFRYQGDTNNSILLENIPIHYLIDAQSLDTIAIQNGTVTLQQIDSRDVQHFNRFQTFQAPIHIGYVKPTGRKLRYGLITSLGFQYSVRQSGRMFAENATIVAFSKNSSFRRFGLNATLRPMLNLSIGKYWQISWSPFASYTIIDRMKKDAVISQRPLTYGVELSVWRDL